MIISWINFVLQIGSSPGFVDSDFESAKLWRPAASFYNVSDGCLYFVDSEVHAITEFTISNQILFIYFSFKWDLFMIVTTNFV